MKPIKQCGGKYRQHDIVKFSIRDLGDLWVCLQCRRAIAKPQGVQVDQKQLDDFVAFALDLRAKRKAEKNFKKPERGLRLVSH